MSITSEISADLNRLIQAVDDADSAILLVKAVENLAAINHVGAISTLIATLNYNNPGAAVAAVDGLIQIGEPAVEQILTQLDGYNYTARAWAIRALAGIGDPRGLVTLLGAATADFALSVRRAAAKGLGSMKWHWFPQDLLEIAHEEALESLLFVAQQDDEWIVRYAAVAGLEALAGAITHYPVWREQIQAQFVAIADQDISLAVRARAIQAQKSAHQSVIPSLEPPPNIDWQAILDNLYTRKGEERSHLAEGDPRKYRGLACAIEKRGQSSTD
jgi:phycocyanobilin lyase beta subunit